MFGLGLSFDYRPADTRTFAAGREQRNTVTLDPMLKALLVHMASWRLWEESGKGEVLGRPLVLRDMGWRAARRRWAGKPPAGGGRNAFRKRYPPDHGEVVGDHPTTTAKPSTTQRPAGSVSTFPEPLPSKTSSGAR